MMPHISHQKPFYHSTNRSQSHSCRQKEPRAHKPSATRLESHRRAKVCAPGVSDWKRVTGFYLMYSPGLSRACCCATASICPSTPRNKRCTRFGAQEFLLLVSIRTAEEGFGDVVGRYLYSCSPKRRVARGERSPTGAVAGSSTVASGGRARRTSTRSCSCCMPCLLYDCYIYCWLYS